MDAWWRAIEATRTLRGLSRRDLAKAIEDAVPRRASETRRSPSYAEVYHQGMLIPRAFAAMELLGCRLCGWRTLAETLTGLEDRRRSTRRRGATTTTTERTASRTLLRDALTSGDIWIEVDDVDDVAFEEALARTAEEGAAAGASSTETPEWPQPVSDARLDAALERLDRLESRDGSAAKRGRPRPSQVAALEERLVALEARVLALEGELQLRENMQGRDRGDAAALDGPRATHPSNDSNAVDGCSVGTAVGSAPVDGAADLPSVEVDHAGTETDGATSEADIGGGDRGPGAAGADGCATAQIDGALASTSIDQVDAPVGEFVEPDQAIEPIDHAPTIDDESASASTAAPTSSVTLNPTPDDPGAGPSVSEPRDAASEEEAAFMASFRTFVETNVQTLDDSPRTVAARRTGKSRGHRDPKKEKDKRKQKRKQKKLNRGR